MRRSLVIRIAASVLLIGSVLAYYRFGELAMLSCVIAVILAGVALFLPNTA